MGALSELPEAGNPALQIANAVGRMVSEPLVGGRQRAERLISHQMSRSGGKQLLPPATF
ncbi:MAG TPA: hypothetical protein VJJ02_04105 [Candidatus Paceibacterota bacterium]